MKPVTCGAMLALSISLALSCTAHADSGSVPLEIVDAMNKVFGVHPGFRANHAKGVVVEGNFKASPDASKLTTSPLYSGRRCRSRCGFPIRAACRRFRTAQPTRIRTAWPSSFTCRTAARATS